MSKQSDSTMHTLKRSYLSQDNFEYHIANDYLDILNLMIKSNYSIDEIKNALPEGFIQGRSICTNYKTIRHIILQRHNHKLSQWKYFCESMKHLKHYDYLGLSL